MKKIILSAMAILTSFNAYADDQKSPWKFLQGRWQVEEDYGFKSEVVFKKLKDGEGATGKWIDQDGNKFSELIGWMPDKKQLVALGIGNNGAYWQCNFTEVKVNQIKGFMVFRDNEGQILQGERCQTQRVEMRHGLMLRPAPVRAQHRASRTLGCQVRLLSTGTCKRATSRPSSRRRPSPQRRTQ